MIIKTAENNDKTTKFLQNYRENSKKRNDNLISRRLNNNNNNPHLLKVKIQREKMVTKNILEEFI